MFIQVDNQLGNMYSKTENFRSLTLIDSDIISESNTLNLNTEMWQNSRVDPNMEFDEKLSKEMTHNVRMVQPTNLDE